MSKSYLAKSLKTCFGGSTYAKRDKTTSVHYICYEMSSVSSFRKLHLAIQANNLPVEFKDLAGKLLKGKLRSIAA